MPNLLIFAACEKVIVDAENSISLVSVFDRLIVNLPMPEGGALLEETIVPMKWYVYAFLKTAPEERGKSFEQRLTLTNPDGSIGIDKVQEFELGERTSRITIMVQGYPIHQAGECALTLYLREVGSDTWNMVAEYPIQIEFRG